MSVALFKAQGDKTAPFYSPYRISATKFAWPVPRLALLSLADWHKSFEKVYPKESTNLFSKLSFFLNNYNRKWIMCAVSFHHELMKFFLSNGFFMKHLYGFFPSWTDLVCCLKCPLCYFFIHESKCCFMLPSWEA